MAYRLRYKAILDWVGPGAGRMTAGASRLGGDVGNAGGAQTVAVFSKVGGQNIVGTGTGGALTGTEVTTLTTAMATDVAAQLNLAANLAAAQGWVTGNP